MVVLGRRELLALWDLHRWQVGVSAGSATSTWHLLLRWWSVSKLLTHLLLLMLLSLLQEDVLLLVKETRWNTL